MSTNSTRPIPDTKDLELLLTGIVVEEDRKSPDEGDPHYETVRRAWLRRDCPKVLEMIEIINHRPGLTRIGSDRISLGEVVPGTPSQGTAVQYQTLHIGNPELKISPLRWLLCLSRGFSRLPGDVRETFNDIVGWLAQNTRPRTANEILGY